ncbi:response regulator [Paenibacillus taichungensis]|uniref:histidine kinase n=1 Tax=Paenibacillus taichungensis TaxID=484184 RepID=A0ABX2MKS5_9BACL|nr:response regulator [Paenibacillus taichungensis]OME78504.1 histidine kinase [Paenibacillus pabuli]MDR9749178.1 response regulator [Paenibacillus taichungensis]MEC0110837.1 response regulator [Paenibacillus taichungensis]MEC0197835.1 response regulator [Paenibacillus taichungensis]NUU54630.1 response regulator [Paenibacillus taichungensis]
MKIRNKLLIGFTALMAIMIVLTFVSYERLNSSNQQIDQMYQERYLKVRYTSSARGEVNDIAKVLANLLLNPNNSISAADSDLKAMQEKGERYLEEVRDRADSAPEHQLVDRVNTAWEAYNAYAARQVSLMSQNRVEDANNYRNATGLAVQKEAVDSLNALSRFQDQEIDTEIKDANAAYMRAVQITVAIMIAGLLLALGVIMWVLPSITRGLNTVSMMITSFGKGRYRTIRRIQVKSTDEIGQIASVFKDVSNDLEEKLEVEKAYLQAQQDQNWMSSNIARVPELLRGIGSIRQISQMFISEFTPVLGAQLGVVYLIDEEKHPDELRRYGAYAFEENEDVGKEVYRIGEGLIGQAALDMTPIILEKTPEDYVNIGSATGSSRASGVMIYPVVFEDELIGVVELASFEGFTNLHTQLFSQLIMNLGVILNNVRRRLRVEELLRESQALTEELQVQSEELQTQQEELRRSNENLEEQTGALKRSEELLQRQQEELEHFNTELIAKTRALEEQVREVEEKNDEIEKTKTQLEQQAMQLSMTSKYKSEFLANMSHELRTPLNSLLILSQLLSENKDGNLSVKQQEYAQTIYMSGADLLKMIDEILDLSKVDAGKMDINYETVRMEELTSFVQQNFGPMANKKELNLNIEFDSNLPEWVYTDSHRVKQILRNLLSNAFKFTNRGSVSLIGRKMKTEELPGYLNTNQEYVGFTVKDTGIGIPSDKTDLIFEAFQQVDGTTSRKYGGTGLGLSISRELARLLGGAIKVESSEGVGSSFTLFLPDNHEDEVQVDDAVREAAVASEIEAFGRDSQTMRSGRQTVLTPDPDSTSFMELPQTDLPVLAQLEDDQENLVEGDKILLIIEDDVNFAHILMDMARGRGFKAIVALQGDKGLEMARQYLPDAIILDIQLPVMDGWAILGELKSSSATRHIPVHVISVIDDMKQGLMMGAIAYLKKPSSKDSLDKAFSHIESYTENQLKRLLIVEDDEIQRKAIIELIGHDDVAITAVSTGSEALNELHSQRYDCMVLDLMLTDMTGFELLDQIRDDQYLNDLPIIIYTGKELDSKEEMKLRKYAESIIIKDVKSPERLLDETTLFLHRVEANLPEDKRRILQKLHNKETLFEGKKILLVDDDIRNVFALSSVLEGYRMDVTFAENGREALEILDKNPEIDLVLMDMMMPEMDGYEAMTRIRQIPKFEKLPIIALTAKAMKDDRGKCIEAGASDYVKKPIQTDQLLSLMRVWLYS